MKLSRAVAALLTTLASSAAAWAGPCDDVLDMLNSGVPTPVVVESIHGGAEFTPDGVQCLVRGGAPAEVVAAARARVVAPADETSSDGEAVER